MSDNVRDLLLALGETEEEIVDSLRVLGVQGVRRSPSRCVFAKYLRQQLGREVHIAFTFTSPLLRVDEMPVPSTRSHLNVAEAFDSGHYPDLIEEFD